MSLKSYTAKADIPSVKKEGASVEDNGKQLIIGAEISRLSKLMIGGITQSILDGIRLPVLMSH